MKNKTYDILKWVAIIACPAISTFYGVIAEIWGLPYVVEIPRTITAFAVLLGALLGISAIRYNKQEELPKIEQDAEALEWCETEGILEDEE